MKPREFEELVANYYQSQGYKTELTSYMGDYGVDLIAQKGDERIAVQAKMYGNSSRKVNRKTVMELQGAMTYFKCNKAVIATNGSCMSDAIEVARSLGIEILYLGNNKGNIGTESEAKHYNAVIISEPVSKTMSFDDVWEQYIMPLSGKAISHGGLTNQIIDVDWGGLKRLSSKGRVGKISIEDFKFAYNQLVEHGSVERVFINQHANRCSSVIVLVLSQVPFIGLRDKPKKMLYLKKDIQHKDGSFVTRVQRSK